MRVSDLRAILRDLERLFGVSGAKVPQSAVARVAKALPSDQDQSLQSYLKKVQEEISEEATPTTEKYLHQLQQVELDEKAFTVVFGALETDKRVKKADLVAIAAGYTGTANPRDSTKKLLKHIKAHFYTKLYERDANELAKRATPV